MNDFTDRKMMLNCNPNRQRADTSSAAAIKTGVALFVSFLCLCAPLSGKASGQETNKLNFGFTGPETYPIDNFIGQLRAADLDGDGLNDLIIVNNSRSKINILYNQTGKTNRVAVPSR